MRQIVRGTAAVLAVVVLMLGACTGFPEDQTPEPSSRRPNIIYFLTDDLSSRLLPYMKTVQQLADHGTTFDDYVVSNSLCCPSRASMFTGEYPHNTGVLTNLDDDHGGYAAFRRHEGRTYADALHGAGYRTGYLGKYINQYELPEDYHVPSGWDEWHVANRGGYNEFRYRISDYVREQQRHAWGDGDGKYLTDLLGDRATGFLRRSSLDGEDKPFFLQVSTFAPHSGVPSVPGDPRFPPAPRDRPSTAWDSGQFEHGDCGGTDCRELRADDAPAFDEDTGDKPSWVRRAPLDDRPQVAKQLDTDFRNSVRMVQSVDDMVARVLNRLTPAQRANTYVVFSSDNGFHLGQHGLLRGKMTAYDHDIRVPLVIARPGQTEGVTRRELAQNVDLFPTLLDMAGIDPRLRDSRDGRSLLPLARDEDPQDWRTAALVEHRKPAAADPRRPGLDPDAEKGSDRRKNSQPPSYDAIRLADELYVEYDTGEREYYDLADDPDEEHNSPDDPRSGELSGPLRTLATCGKDGRPGCWDASHIG